MLVLLGAVFLAASEEQILITTCSCADKSGCSGTCKLAHNVPVMIASRLSVSYQHDRAFVEVYTNSSLSPTLRCVKGRNEKCSSNLSTCARILDVFPEVQKRPLSVLLNACSDVVACEEYAGVPMARYRLVLELSSLATLPPPAVQLPGLKSPPRPAVQCRQCEECSKYLHDPAYIFRSMFGAVPWWRWQEQGLGGSCFVRQRDRRDELISPSLFFGQMYSGEHCAGRRNPLGNNLALHSSQA